MEAIAHLVPQSEIAAESFAQYQLGDSGNVCGFENRLWQGVNHMLSPNKDRCACIGTGRTTAYPKLSADEKEAAATSPDTGYQPVRHAGRIVGITGQITLQHPIFNDGAPHKQGERDWGDKGLNP